MLVERDGGMYISGVALILVRSCGNLVMLHD